MRYAASVGMNEGGAARRSTAATGIRSARRGRSRRRSAELEAADGPFDLILFGNESADSGGFQVGIRVAHALGRPMVNGGKGLDVADGVAQVRRESDAGREIYELPLPAVVGVKEGINLPRYPTMKGRLASKKVEVAHDRARGGGAGGLSTMVALRRRPSRRRRRSSSAPGADAVAGGRRSARVEIGVL